MSPREHEICIICSAETHDETSNFCPTCERRMEQALLQLNTDGAAVMVPHRVN